MSENMSKEVAILMDENMNEFPHVLGTEEDVDLNITGRSRAKYVVHNHPNNSSFSNRDISWFVKNKNVKYFSIAKNNGLVETLIRTDSFNESILKVEYERLVKKYKNDIEKNKQKGYSMVVEKLLQKTKSGLIYVR